MVKPFDYYYRLSRRQQAVYRKSDTVTRLPLPDPASLHPLVSAINAALAGDDRKATGRATSALCKALCEALQAPPVTVRVLTRRPSSATEELHGLYEREEGKRPIIRVWMRTAAHERTVAVRTFVRTVLHELCHHLDYELLGLDDSFHTQGFFARESSLARQLLPKPPPKPPAAKLEAAEKTDSPGHRQLSLPGL